MRLAAHWKAFRRRRRLRIFLAAVLLGVLCGVTMIGLPLDDILINARSTLVREKAPQNIVIVALDDRTLSELGKPDTPRSADAQVIDRLFAAGASKVYLDRTYHFAEAPNEDAALLAALKRHSGKVAMGATFASSDPVGAPMSMLPAEKFRDHIEIVSLQMRNHPFNLNVRMPITSETIGGPVRSMAASLAEVEGRDGRLFSPNFGIALETVPIVSYIDVLNGTNLAIDFTGKKVVVAPFASVFQDTHPMPGHGDTPGVYFQVLAAYTLQNGMPVMLGWLPAMLVALAIGARSLVQGRQFNRTEILGLALLVLVAPGVFAQFGIQMQVFPALAASLLVGLRVRSLEKTRRVREQNEASGLPSLQALRVAKPQGGSLIALKIRNYAAINNVFGRPVEAELAQELVRRIRISDPDATIYHDGDLFLWTSTLANPLDLVEHLEGLHRIVRNGIIVDDHEIDLSFNCGVDIETGKPMAIRIGNVRQAAEEALRSEELVAIFEATSNDEQWEISLLSALEHAIDDGDVWVAYQPKLDLQTNRIVSAEALVRWTHPERGPINPEKFIGIAEQYHRIDRITRFVLDEAVATAASLRRMQEDFSISVNISAQLLRDQDLPRMISEALSAHGFPAEKLILEITETDRLEKSARTVSMMHRLVESGVQLSIDDFGTGNATIDYLRYLPAVEVKIDKSFVSNIETNKQDQLLVQSIIEMAHSLDRRVVAEGVENEAIIEMLRLLECDIVQGYHISRPIAFDELVRLIDAGFYRQAG